MTCSQHTDIWEKGNLTKSKLDFYDIFSEKFSENKCLKHYLDPSKGFVDTDNLIVKLIFNGTNLTIAKTILTKKNKVGRISLPDIKT